MKINILCLLLIITISIEASEKNTSKIEPYLAGLLSWHMSGFGHFYAKDYKRGSLYVFGDILIKTTGIYITSEFDKKYEKYHSEYFVWDDCFDKNHTISGFSKEDKIVIIGYLTASLLFKIISTTDAIISAYQYNKKMQLITNKNFLVFEEKF